MTEKTPSLPRWLAGVATVVAAMACGGWVNDQRRDAAESVMLTDLRSDFAELKHTMTEGNAQLERNSAGRALANREEYLRIVSQIERRLDRLEEGK